MNEPITEMVWDEKQREAIDRCCDMQQRIVPITGVAGTGKTSIIKEVYNRLTEGGYSVVLCAPTGKAARRITEATGIDAVTMHRLLEYTLPGDKDDSGEPAIPGEPRRGKGIAVWDDVKKMVVKRDVPIEYQVVIADEYAMVTHELHRNLIHALPPGGRVCMFGDINQLKPIEKGRLAEKETPFEAALRKFDGVTLETIHRTDARSGIARNGKRILSGYVPTRNDEFAIISTHQPVRVLETHVMRMLDEGINFGSNQGQVISPTKKTWIGTHAVNTVLQRLLNPVPKNERFPLARHQWDTKHPVSIAVGDKVIWTENAYDLRDEADRYEEVDAGIYVKTPVPPEKQIMNGESGVVKDITPDGTIQIDVGDRVVEVPPLLTVVTKRGKKAVTIDISPHRMIDLGFCITTHKAQGSEWDHIIYLLNKSSRFIQSRSNLYTAVTRASASVCVISDPASLQHSVTAKMSIAQRKDMRS